MFSRSYFYWMLLRLHVARLCRRALPDIAPARWYAWSEPMQDAWIERYFKATDAGKMAANPAN